MKPKNYMKKIILIREIMLSITNPPIAAIK
jgi:hypothetical protein